jgi:type II secretory pathway component PulJ
MKCKLTSSQVRQTRIRGFTLAELMVAFGISALLLTVLLTLSLYSGRSFAAMVNYVDLNQRSRAALDSMSRDIRQARDVLVMSATSVTVVIPEPGDLTVDNHPAVTRTNHLTFSWDPGTKLLTSTLKKSDGTEEISQLLNDCENLKFEYFMRAPLTLVPDETWTQPVAPRADHVKEIQVSWVCSRQIMGITRNTESIQTARIVIRKSRDPS